MQTDKEAERREQVARVNGGANGHSTRLSHAELRERIMKETEGKSCLVAEPLDSGLWPTAGLSDRQIELLTEALRKVRRRQLSKAA